MVAKGVADETTGNLTFLYERLQMPFMFVIPVEAGTYTALDVCTEDDVIAVSGTMNAFSLDKEIHNAVYDNHLSIGLSNITFTSDEIQIPGEEGTFEIRITDAGTTTYSVTTDVDWLSASNAPTSGSATAIIKAEKGTTKERTGYVIVSESVTYKGTTITLQNKIKVTQDFTGMSIIPGGWDDSGEDLGGDAV